MKITSGYSSGDVEDRRGFGGGRSLGIIGTLVLGGLSLLFGQDFFSLFNAAQSVAPPTPSASRRADPADPQVNFVSFVLDDIQQTWTTVFEANGQRYQRAKLVLFTGAVRSACGNGQAAMGPFYCPADQKAYIDLSFYDELRARFGAPGDFAQAYVLAHELGHHVQHLLGIDEKVRGLQRSQPSQANALSVRMELQADCLAGVWAHSTQQRDLLEKGDVEEALGAAAAIGDDRIQKGTKGRISPESWTHGSSAQRMEWFKRGVSSGRIEACDTFQTR